MNEEGTTIEGKSSHPYYLLSSPDPGESDNTFIFLSFEPNLSFNKITVPFISSTLECHRRNGRRDDPRLIKFLVKNKKKKTS